MRSLYLGSTSTHAGKSLLTYGIGKLLRAQGYRIGYLKPLGGNPTMVDNLCVDSDAAFLARALDLSDPLTLISPVIADRPHLELPSPAEAAANLDKVAEAHRQIAADKDVVLIGGSGDLVQGKSMGLDGPTLTGTLDARAVVVITQQDEHGLDTLLAARNWFGERLAGVIFNRIAKARLDHVRNILAPALESAGVNVFGILPEDDILGSVSVGELARHLRGEVLVGKERTDLLVERFLVGAMNLESALKFLRRAKNKAVITGGDRADIQLAALETSTRCLILTGGHYPNEIILSKAQDAGVPLIVVRDDTFSVVEKVEQAMGTLHPHEAEKLHRAAGMVEAGIDLPRLLAALGVKPA